MVGEFVAVAVLVFRSGGVVGILGSFQVGEVVVAVVLEARGEDEEGDGQERAEGGCFEEEVLGGQVVGLDGC